MDERDTPEEILHLRAEYAALLTMCDEKLGEVLDLLDEYGMWKDTMVIVNTDHGFLLAEHGQWAKCHCPFYNEVARIPLFVWDPVTGARGIHADSLVQTIDLPGDDSRSVRAPAAGGHGGSSAPAGACRRRKVVRKAALYGIFGGRSTVPTGGMSI